MRILLVEDDKHKMNDIITYLETFKKKIEVETEAGWLIIDV